MPEQIKISEAATATAFQIYSAEPNIELMEEMLQQLLNTETEKLRKENEELKAKIETLLEYASHRPTCPMPANKCDCGLDELIAPCTPSS